MFIIKAVGVLSRRRRRRRLADGNGCCLLLRSSTPTETRLVLFFCCCCCCEGVDRARIIVVIVIIFFGSVYCVVVVLGGQSLFKDVFCARNNKRCENVTTIFELENSFENVTQNARHNTIRPYSKERKKEMAGDSAKKIVQRNGRKLKFLRGLVFSSFLQHALVRIAYSRYYLNGGHHHPVWMWHTLFWSVASYGCYRSLAKHARPTRDPHTKEMIDPGHDLSEPGVTQYYFDTIYVTCASMWLSSFWSDRFWYVTWVIPAYGAYVVYGYVGPYVKNFSRNNETDERESKHEKRMRERRERRQQKSARRR